MKKVVTQEDLDLNPELEEQGIAIGDEIDIPENAGNDDEGEGGPGGGQPKPPETGKPKDPPDEP